MLIALTLATVTMLRDNPAGVAATMGAYAVALAILLWWHRTKFRISDRKSIRRYALGFGLTIVSYMAGIVWESATFPSWAIFAPYCVLVSVPGLAAAAKPNWGSFETRSRSPAMSRPRRPTLWADPQIPSWPVSRAK